MSDLRNDFISTLPGSDNTYEQMTKNRMENCEYLSINIVLYNNGGNTNL